MKDVYSPDETLTRGLAKLRMDDQIITIISKAIDSLTKREKSLLRLKYGLDGDSPLTLRQIGERIGRSAPLVQQVVARARRKLGHPVRCGKIIRLLEALAISN
jgi:RNA polymerase sigma factor (sigma-70 family)